jgi:hypothetical protein
MFHRAAVHQRREDRHFTSAETSFNK